VTSVVYHISKPEKKSIDTTRIIPTCWHSTLCARLATLDFINVLITGPIGKIIVVKDYHFTNTSTKEVDLSAYGNKWFHFLKSYPEPEKRKEFEGDSIYNEKLQYQIIDTSKEESQFVNTSNIKSAVEDEFENGVEKTNGSDGSWETFCAILKEAQRQKTIGNSPDNLNHYTVKDIQSSKIIFMINGVLEAAQGKKGYLFFMDHFNDCDTPQILDSYLRCKTILNLATHEQANPAQLQRGIQG